MKCDDDQKILVCFLIVPFVIERKCAMSDSDDKKKTETIKLVFDLLKHLTTLSSGSILLILALIDKLFIGKQLPKLLLVAPCLFIVSVVSALISMVVISFTSGKASPSNIETSVFAWGFTLSAFAFGAGMFFVLVVLLASYG